MPSSYNNRVTHLLKQRTVIYAFGLLAIGCLTYLTARENSFVFVQSLGWGKYAPAFVKYNLVDLAWGIAFQILFLNATTHIKTRLKILVIPFMGISQELLQHFFPLFGTFDPIDISCYTLVLLLSPFIKL